MEIKCPDCGNYYKDSLVQCPECIAPVKESPKTKDISKKKVIMEKKCKYCAMMIPREVKICPHCRKTQGLNKYAIIIPLSLLLLWYVISALSPPSFDSYKEKAKNTPPKIDSPTPQAEPYSFKDFKLGMTLAEFNNLNPRVTYKKDEKFETSLFVDTTIGGSGKQAFFLFGEYGKGLQLSYISITIPKADFPSVKDALISKYGSPTSTSNIVKSNAMGATFNGEKLIWNNGTSEIIAESIGSKIDQADIIFHHLKFGQSKQDQETSAKTKKDI